MAPLFILLIVYGCEKIMTLFPAQSKWKYVIPALLLAGPLMNSTLQIINTKLFGEHKYSDQRAGFLFINDRLQKGDQVYMFWNNLHFYQYYKEAYNLNFEAVQGRDVKFESTDIEDYQQRLDSQINSYAGKKRVWIMYNKFHKYEIGEMENQIPWYDKEEVIPGNLLHNRFSAIGKEIESYETGEFKISLFDLSGK
jgi:hypothetical protein